MRDYYLQSGHPSLQVVAAIPPEFDDPADHDALAFEFFESTYNLWLDHVDDLSEPKQIVEEKYGVYLAEESAKLLPSFR